MDDPVIQVHTTDHGQFQTFSSCFDNVKIVTLGVVNQNGHQLTACIMLHLSDMAIHLHKGHLLRLPHFNDVMMKITLDSPYQAAAIVVAKMTIIGSGSLIQASMDTPTSTMDSLPQDNAMEHATNSGTVPLKNAKFEHLYGLNFWVCIYVRRYQSQI